MLCGDAKRQRRTEEDVEEAKRGWRRRLRRRAAATGEFQSTQSGFVGSCDRYVWLCVLRVGHRMTVGVQVLGHRT